MFLRNMTYAFAVTSLVTLFTVQPVQLTFAKETTVDIFEKTNNFREEFGLKTGTRTVRSLYNQDAELSKYGVLLTEEEEKELDERFAKQKKDIPKVREYIEKHLQKEFAGLYIDQSLGGVVKVGFKESEKEKVENFIDDLKGLYDDEMLQIYFTEHSVEELNELADKISEDRLVLEKEGVELSSISVNVPNQKVDVGVTKINPRILKLFEDKYELDLLNIFEEEIHKAEADPDDYYRPIEAGLEVR